MEISLHLVRYLSIAGLALSAAWIGAKPDDMKSYISIIASLVALLKFEADFFKLLSTKESDRLLLNKLKAELPSHGSISFMKDCDFGGLFYPESLEQLYVFFEIWKGPEFAFLDPMIEKRKQTLIRSINDFRDALGEYTWRDEHERLSVPPEWRTSNRPRWDRVVRKLNQLADHVVVSHESLIKYARSVLKDI